jgi:hypothetical protein
MTKGRGTIVIAIMGADKGIGGRTELVRLPRGADSTLFGGWGVRI